MTILNGQPAISADVVVEKVAENTTVALINADRRQTGPLTDPGTAQDVRERCKIMIVDDEPTVINVVCKHLKDAGCQNLITTTDSTRALEIIKREQPDVILLDIMMPHISGLELLESMRSDDRLRDIPVLILTVASDANTRQQALELGAADFLTKPVERNELLKAVASFLDGNLAP